MNQTNKFITSRRLLLSHIMVAAAIVLLIILTAILAIVKQQEKLTLEKNTTAWAKSIAQTSVYYLEQKNKDGHKQLHDKLAKIITAPNINYVHIYRKNATDNITFYTGFNKSDYFPAIPDKIADIEKLTDITYQKNYLELIVKLENKQQLLGYLYIQSNTEDVDDFITKMILLFILLFLFGLVIAALLAIMIQRKINQPITTMIESIQGISQSKDYSRRLATLPVIELDVLARNINILLNTTQRYLIKQEDIHQLAIQQNNKLSNKVTARTDALKESNQELLNTLDKLHQFQRQLVENEKMASLGDMVAGIAHEVNTPIGLGVTASTLMSDRLNEIKQAFEDKTLKSSQLKKFLIQGEENISIIYRNLERAAKLISSFKKVAVDQSTAEVSQFNVNDLINEVLLTLKAKIMAEQVTVTIDCPEQLIVKSKPGPINQIIINLIINSIIHGFEQKPQGTINISIQYFSNQLHISYQDDGIGIDENIKGKIFEPFTTTKRGSGGSGLGLHLVYNLVTQALSGHIDFESSKDTGTSFDITFPVVLVAEP